MVTTPTIKPEAKSTAIKEEVKSPEEKSVFSGLLNPGLLSTAISLNDSIEFSRSSNMRALNRTFDNITRDPRFPELAEFCNSTGLSIPLCEDWDQNADSKTFAITKDGIKLCNRLVDEEGEYKVGDGINFEQSKSQNRFAVALALRHASFASHPTTVKAAFEDAVEAVREGKVPSQNPEPYRYAGV